MCFVYTAALAISRPSPPLPRFLGRDLCLRLLPSLPLPCSVYFRSSLSLCSSWQGEITSPAGLMEQGAPIKRRAISRRDSGAGREESVYLLGLSRRVVLISLARPRGSSETHSTLVWRHKRFILLKPKSKSL